MISLALTNGIIYIPLDFDIWTSSKVLKTKQYKHREAKQKLGLEILMMRSWKKLINHVGFVCLAYSLLTVLKQISGGSIGDIKFKIVDEVLGI